MDGLECSEILISNLEFSARIDAEYYQKGYLKYEEKVENCCACRMGEVSDFLIGPFGSAYDTDNYVDFSNYRYIRGQDVKPFFVQDNLSKFIAGHDYLRLQKYSLSAGDILVSVVGTLGNACIVRENETPAIFSCKSTAVIAKSINRFYLITYLNSKYGRKLLLRKERGAIQKGLNLDDLKSLTIPRFTESLYLQIETAIKAAFASVDESKKRYQIAETILHDILCVSKCAIFEKTYSEKKLSASFASSGRLDAEYYQPKYEAIAQKLNTRETVLSLCNLYDKNFNPDEKQTYQYIELADVGQSGDIFDVDIQYGSDLPTRARRIVKSGQIIVSSVEGSLQSCALITSEYDGALCSTGFYVLDSDSINSETLLVLFKSEPIQALMKQRCSGTILTAISKDELLSMPLPMIEENVQKEIAAKVQESFALRKQSKQLLEYAKQAVEMAIEQGEDVAMEWLKDKV